MVLAMKMKVTELGEFIRSQRRGAQMSLRKLATAAGVSNPYLSQIERGLRRPSAEILQAIAKALRVSAQTLYVQAGILEEEVRPDVQAAIMGEPNLTERQKQVLIEVYDSFREETDRRRAGKKRTVAPRARRAETPRPKSAAGAVGARKKAEGPSRAARRVAHSKSGSPQRTGGRTEMQAEPKPSPGSPSSFRRQSSTPDSRREV
jgi:transcriptional regulator with XRE-family HTH domain